MTSSMQRKTALVTGAGAGIGSALAIRLAALGYDVTVIDVNEGGARSTVKTIRQSGGCAEHILCDVSDDAAQQRAFDRHMSRCGQLDLAVLNAGIGEKGSLLRSDDGGGWRSVLEIDLMAAIWGVRLATRAMLAGNTPGTIIVTASAAGVYPISEAPVYAAAKAGILHFTRSISGQLKSRGIRIAALCPQFTETNMVREAQTLNAEGARRMMGDLPLLTVERVVSGAMLLIQQSSVGPALLILQNGGVIEWPSKRRLELPAALAKL